MKLTQFVSGTNGDERNNVFGTQAMVRCSCLDYSQCRFDSTTTGTHTFTAGSTARQICTTQVCIPFIL